MTLKRVTTYDKRWSKERAEAHSAALKKNWETRPRKLSKKHKARISNSVKKHIASLSPQEKLEYNAKVGPKSKHVPRDITPFLHLSIEEIAEIHGTTPHYVHLDLKHKYGTHRMYEVRAMLGRKKGHKPQNKIKQELLQIAKLNLVTL